MEFAILMKRAKAGDDRAIEEILNMYTPLLRKHSFVHNAYDEKKASVKCGNRLAVMRRRKSEKDRWKLSWRKFASQKEKSITYL